MGLCGSLFPVGTFRLDELHVACSSTWGLKSEEWWCWRGVLGGHLQVWRLCQRWAVLAVKNHLMSSYGKSFFFLYSKCAHCCSSPLGTASPFFIPFHQMFTH